MAEVYLGPCLNLAASTAHDGTKDLFFPRMEPIRVGCKLFTGEEDNIFIPNTPKDYTWDSRESPLAFRA
jgi:hypothetical protein